MIDAPDKKPLDNAIAPPLRLGIVGCGSARAFYGPVLRLVPGLEVTALMDADLVAARAWARHLNRVVTYTDYDAFLAEAPVDSVLIASPILERPAQTLAAARAGKHILCEKPLARSLAECDQMIQAAKQHGVILMSAFPKRFERTFRHAAELLALGRLGELIQARCEWSFYAGEGVQHDALRTWEGVFEEFISHTIDLCRWWLGPVETVSGDVDVTPVARPHHEMANLILNHRRGVSVHHISRISHKGAGEQYILKGTEATLHISSGADWRYDSLQPFRMSLHLPDHSEEDVTPPPLPRPEEQTRLHHPARRLLESFVESIRAHREPETTGDDARHVIETIQAAYLSTLEKTKIVLPLTHSIHREVLFQRIQEQAGVRL